jgi:type I restriction enzyme, S subunit
MKAQEACTCLEISIPLGYKRTGVGVIPADWEARAVGRMGSVVAGKALAVRTPGRLRPYLRTKNVFDGRIDLGDVLWMPMTESQFEAYQVHPGDVLLNEGQSLELVGRCAIYNGEYHEPCAIQNQLVRFRAYDGVSAEYAAHLFRYCQQTGVFARIALQTTSIAHLGVGRFQRLLLPWPAQEVEQRAIAAALSDVDALIEALDAAVAKKRAIKLAAMQQLLTGNTRVPGFRGEWVCCKLADLGQFSKGRGIRRDDVTDHGVACIRYGELYTRYDNYVLNPASRIPPEVALSALPIHIGDLLFAGSGETAEEIGKCVAYVGEEVAYAGGDIVVLTPSEQNPIYLGHLMNHREVAQQKARYGQGDAVVHISARNLALVDVTLPSKDEQDAIACVLLDMDAEIAALEKRREKTRAIKQGMMQALLTGRVRLVTDEGQVTTR